MNHLAVDLDPAPLGRTGQVIEYGRDVYGPLRYVSGSITDPDPLDLSPLRTLPRLIRSTAVAHCRSSRRCS